MIAGAIPLCWPAPSGACGCGRAHPDKNAGKAPLVDWERFVADPPSEQQVAEWRRRWPSANWACLLEPAGLLVVDLDGEAAIAEALAMGLPPGPVVKTGKGCHRYFRAPEAPAGRAARRGRCRAIDILSAGCIVIPPSRHRTGAVYRWLVSPDQAPLTAAPEWAVAMIRESVCTGPATLPDELPTVDVDRLYVSWRIRALVRSGGDACYPSRSEALFAVMQAMIKSGYDDSAIAAVMLDPGNGIASKPLEQGPRWLARELARARAKCPALVIV